jgi:RNA-directed DNA polymerase
MLYSPGIGSGALKRIGEVIREKWCLHHKHQMSLSDVAREVNPMVRGWIGYYGHHRRSELYKMAYIIDNALARFLKRKCKSMQSDKKSLRQLREERKLNPELFCHWFMICQGRRAV